MAIDMSLPELPQPAGFKQQSGAFDLPSVLIGVAVVAILAVGVMAAVFGVIPWAQDRAAMQDLAAVNTAQGTSYAREGSFTGKTALVGDGLLGEETPRTLVARADTEGGCYVAVTTAKTGNRFVVTSSNPSPRALTDDDTWCSGAPVSDTKPVMISTWNTGLADTCKEIGLPVTGFKGTVDWGDGTRDAATRHTYAKTGDVTIRIDGTFTAWGGWNWADANCLISVDRWGATDTANLTYAFYNADNLKHVESTPPSAVNMSSAFSNIDSSFTLGMLSTSRVTTMASMFNTSPKFNSPVEFDTSKVLNMSGMFYQASAFNQPLDLDTSSAADLGGMFYSAKSFNSRVSFDTSKVTNMASMFDLAEAFNQPLNFDTSSVLNTAAMFSNAKSFNHPVDFDTSKATNTFAMFNHALSFNQPVRFNTSNVLDMHTMFAGALAFNQPLAFDTSKVTDMRSMFDGAVKFNQDLSGWNVKKVTAYAGFAGPSLPAVNQPRFGL